MVAKHVLGDKEKKKIRYIYALSFSSRLHGARVTCNEAEIPDG
jgi:hypothetical protein